jgi:hypothetical protein
VSNDWLPVIGYFEEPAQSSMDFFVVEYGFRRLD